MNAFGVREEVLLVDLEGFGALVLLDQKSDWILYHFTILAQMRCHSCQGAIFKTQLLIDGVAVVHLLSYLEVSAMDCSEFLKHPRHWLYNHF